MNTLVVGLKGAAATVRGLDRPWLALAILFAVLAAVAPGQAVESVLFTAGAFVGIAPYLAVSVALAAGLKAAGADNLIRATAGRSILGVIVLAAAAGTFSPFCSCGVVPLIAALLAAGMPVPAVMAFWLSSPIMDPEMFVLMWAAIGLKFTLAKTVAAYGLGLAGGLATLGLQRAGLFAEPLRVGVGTGRGGCGGGPPAPTAVRWAFWREPERRAIFAAEARVVGWFLVKWLLLAFAIESLMAAWLPGDLIATHLGGAAAGAIPLAVVFGVPAYLNGYAAIPLIGELMAMGMAPGAALAFLVAGGITSLPAAMAVFALVRLP
ncbi:MAG: permease, partial [Kiloniellaceae bacterium]